MCPRDFCADKCPRGAPGVGEAGGAARRTRAHVRKGVPRELVADAMLHGAAVARRFGDVSNMPCV